MAKLPKTPSVGGGKLWGNQITKGYLTQTRSGNGRFATKSQAAQFQRRIDRAKIRPKTKAQRGPRPVKPVPAHFMNLAYEGKKKSYAKLAVGGASVGTALTLIGLGNRLSPSLDFSRKHFRVGVKPTVALGSAFKLSTSHSIGIERVTPDLYDRTRDRATGKVSQAVARVVGDGSKGQTVQDVTDGLLGRKKEFSINGVRIKNTEPLQPRRWRYQANTENESPPGAPAVKKTAKPRRRPQGSRKGKASGTITNSVKRQPGGVVVKGKKSKQRSKKKRVY